MAELKPCDCGCVLCEVKHTKKGFHAYCINGHTTGYYDTKQQAIDAWNKRS